MHRSCSLYLDGALMTCKWLITKVCLSNTLELSPLQLPNVARTKNLCALKMSHFGSGPIQIVDNNISLFVWSTHRREKHTLSHIAQVSCFFIPSRHPSVLFSLPSLSSSLSLSSSHLHPLCSAWNFRPVNIACKMCRIYMCIVHAWWLYHRLPTHAYRWGPNFRSGCPNIEKKNANRTIVEIGNPSRDPLFSSWGSHLNIFWLCCATKAMHILYFAFFLFVGLLFRPP